MLSIVIPAYNEQDRLPQTIRRIQEYFKHREYAIELIVVDDGSMDNMLRTIPPGVKVIQNGINRGKGYSVRKGVLAAGGDYILFSDADLSTPIEEIEKLKLVIDSDYDIAIGSRAVRGADVKVHQPFFRELMGKVFNLLVRLLVVRGISDTQCGFKAFRKDAAKEIFSRQKLNGFGFDVEVLYLAKKLGYKIKETPVTWINSPSSKVNVLSDPLKM
ncbi:MAG: dolichyl-phosphate beta-glucosyltransferase, partial [Candidatus Margulisiibacteriota bacterium]